MKVTLQNGQSQDYTVTGVTFTNKKCPALQPGDSFVFCTMRVILELDGTLPAGLTVGVKLKFGDEAFSSAAVVDGLPLEQFRGGIAGRLAIDQGLAAGKDRDPVRANVVEVGGG